MSRHAQWIASYVAVFVDVWLVPLVCHAPLRFTWVTIAWPMVMAFLLLGDAGML